MLDKGMKLTDAGTRTGNGADIALCVGHRKEARTGHG